MTDVIAGGAGAASAASGRIARCAGLLGAAALAGACGLLWTDPSVTARVLTSLGSELATLLRFMALIKAALAAATLGAIAWRMVLPATFLHFTLYLAAASVMAFGPGLIWGLTHVLLGAACLHGGLVVCIVTLWRDSIVASRLSELVALRRRDLGLDPQADPSAAHRDPAEKSATGSKVRHGSHPRAGARMPVGALSGAAAACAATPTARA